MALYALDGDSPVYAGDAVETKSYLCTGCKLPVRVRRGRFRIPHFYHLRTSPSCRLYSKSEDHLIAQLTLQSLLPPGESFIEKPILEIMRVADVLWEPRRLVFEIQCSEFTPFEVAKRNSDYQKVGYQVVWILDDRLYNKKVLRPGEALARTQPCYYGSIRKTEQPMFYDQFELIQEEIRIYRGWRMRVHFKTPLTLPERDWDADIFPKQVIAKAASNNLYFRGDLIHYSIQSEIIPSYSRAIHNLKSLEIIYDIKDESTLWRKFLHTWILEPLGCLYLGVYDWLEKKNLSS